MQTVTLQVPMSRTLRNDATAVAKEMGFSSLQEVLRIITNKIAHKQLAVSIDDTRVLSRKNDLRYEQMIKDIESGQGKTFKLNDKQAMMDYLES